MWFSIIRRLRKARIRHALSIIADLAPKLVRGEDVSMFVPKLMPDKQVITLDYPIFPKSRYPIGTPPYPELYEIISRNSDRYRRYLENFLQLLDEFRSIQVHEPECSSAPRWINGYLPALDSISIYGFIVLNRPCTYCEIGSGNSTKFARKAIIKHGVPTRIISIDPQPRAEVDGLCDTVIRKPLEECDLSIFDQLGAGDIVFFDGTHRAFPNSDVTVFFLEVLPRLKPGVFIHIHDIVLPWDYTLDMAKHYFSEQYLLATLLLAKGPVYDIIFPNRFITDTPALHSILAPVWNLPELKGIETHGCSFWLEKK